MQTLDVQTQKTEQLHVSKSAKSGKTGAETARNGSSFLAMIEKMIAGTMDGVADSKGLSAAKAAARGAGDAKMVPGDENILNKPGSGKDKKNASIKKNGSATPEVEKSMGKNLKKIQSGMDKTSDAKDADPITDAKKALSAALSKKEPAGQSEAVPEEKTEPADKEKSAKKTGLTSGDASSALLALVQKDQLNVSANATSSDLTGKTETGDDKSLTKTVSARIDRKDRKSLINVRDERSDALTPSNAESPSLKSTKINGDSTADMSIGFRSMDGAQTTAGENKQLIERRDGEGQSFSTMLSQELKNNAADFVKTGQIVLRDNNAGLIRLTLHPESLGNVRISLELSGDKKISGKIEVSSQEAYDAFNENLNGLSDAFIEGGFDSAGFDLSWSGQGSESGARQETSTKIISPFYASSVPDVMSATESSDSVKGGYRYAGSPAINVFA